VWLMSGQRLVLTRRQWGVLCLVALLANSYPFLMQPWLMAMGADHSFLAMFVPLTPLMTIAASIPLLGIRPSWQQLLGVVGGLLLVSLIAGDSHQHGLAWKLVPVAISIPLTYAVGNTYLRRDLHSAPALPLTTLLLAIAGAVLLPWMIIELATAIPQAGGRQWGTTAFYLLMLGPIGSGLCIVMLVRLVQVHGPLFAGMVTYVVPVIALFWGWMTSEQITLVQLLAMAGVLAMVALVQSSTPLAPPTEAPGADAAPQLATSGTCK
jgi:drug/metabolite transporter (DMT)-like permease